MRYYNEKKRKFALWNTAITALFIAGAILLNVIVYALGSHFLWYVDMTGGQVYSLSEECKDVLADLDDEVNIYFTVEEDNIYETSANLYTVYQTAKQIEKNFKTVSVKCIDIIKNPAFFKSYYTTLSQDIHTTSVIVESGTEFRLYEVDAFYITNEDGNIWAYEGEYKLASAILTVTAAEMPVAAFTVSHGETTDEGAERLTALFEDGGFQVVKVDLAKEDFPEDTRIVVVNNPVYDFAGIEAGEYNEIDKLDKFMDSYGTLMVFSSPENSGNLSNLSEFLSEWGIAFTPDTYIKDSENSLSVDGKNIIADYEEDSMGASLYLDIANMENAPKTVMGECQPIEILFEEDDQLDGTKQVSPVLCANEGAVSVTANGEEKADGAPLMTVTRETRLVDEQYYYSYVLVCGSSDFVSDTNIRSTAYGNRDIIYNTMKTTGVKRVLANIDYKVLDDTEMTVTTAAAVRWTVALTVTMPVIFAIIGTVVYIRRKNL